MLLTGLKDSVISQHSPGLEILSIFSHILSSLFAVNYICCSAPTRAAEQRLAMYVCVNHEHVETLQFFMLQVKKLLTVVLLVLLS